METQNVTCDLCGCADYSVLWDKTEREKAGTLHSVTIRDGENIIHGRNVMCMNCGLVYVNPRMTREALDKFYAEDYRKVYNSQHNTRQEHEHAHMAYMFIRDLEGSHLDIGCSTGQLIKVTGGHGLEPNREHYEIAKANGVNVTNCTIEDYNPGRQFDIITMLNALEHVISPTAVLQKIHSLLTDSGHFLCSVPNLLSTSINLPVDAFLSNAHLYNFTPATLHMMMAKVGLHIVRAWPITEEMGEKIYVLARKGEPTEIVFDDNIEKRYEHTKRFLQTANTMFMLKHYLSGGIK